MADDLFDRIITEVLQELPSDLKEALASVEINIQEKPTPDQLERSGLAPDSDLFGLFDGLSLKDWPLGRDRTFPDRITLFEEPLRRHFPKRQDLARQIRVTLVHELGHYFGFSEKELNDRGCA